LAFAPLYSSTTNQFTSIPGVTVSYDGNGNLLTDNLNSYTWDAYGSMATVTPSGGATVTITYDALGRMVENNAGGTYTEFVYGPTGAKLAKVNGTTLIKALVALPGGAKAIYNTTGLAYFRHSDWLGSSRLTSTATRPTSMYSSSAYAPFSERYAQAGSVDASFTGQDQDTVSTLYDFLARRQSPSQGRWISPDPAGRRAVSLADPQSWNRYAYVNNNPLSNVDPEGLFMVGCFPYCLVGDDDGGGGGGGGGGGYSGGGSGGGLVGDDDNSGDDNSGNPDQTCDAACQAAQSLSYAYNDPDCAAAIDGRSGAAGAALGAYLDGNNGSQFSTIANFTTADLGNNLIFAWTQSGVFTSDITLNSNISSGFYAIGSTSPGQGFPEGGDPSLIYQVGIPGYGPLATQAIVFGHELGHAAVNAGYQSAVVPDAPGGVEDSGLSDQNNDAIGNACFPQGDAGGNTGPLDQGGGDVPAVAKRARRIH
jgi:RHS repeat-associated protein